MLVLCHYVSPGADFKSAKWSFNGSYRSEIFKHGVFICLYVATKLVMFNAKPIEHLNGYESRTCYLGELKKIAGIYLCIFILPKVLCLCVSGVVV